MDCEVTIFSTADEGIKTASRGALEENENGFKLSYILDGDESEIIYDGNCLTQTRAGGTRLKIEFIEKAHTECAIECAGNKGFLPVFTKKLQVLNAPDGKRIKIAYDLGGMNIELEISALKI